jgi:hypothetical protein
VFQRLENQSADPAARGRRDQSISCASTAADWDWTRQ